MDYHEEQDTGPAGRSQVWLMKDSDSARPDISPAVPGLACNCKRILLQSILAIWELRHACPLKLTYHLEGPVWSTPPDRMPARGFAEGGEQIGRAGPAWQLTDASRTSMRPLVMIYCVV